MRKILNVLVRRYMPKSELDSALQFYEAVFGQPPRLRFHYERYDLEIAQIGAMLIVAGSEENLLPFRSTSATFMVEDLDDWHGELMRLGAVIIEAPKSVPTGRNMRVRHPDGMIAEYVEHAGKHPADNVL
jgi:predicted enzyme related to lactoylglutathione lyase